MVDRKGALERVAGASAKGEVEAAVRKAAVLWPGFAVGAAQKGDSEWALRVEIEGLLDRAGGPTPAGSTGFDSAATSTAGPRRAGDPARGEVERLVSVSVSVERTSAAPAAGTAKGGPLEAAYFGTASLRRIVPESQPPIDLVVEAVGVASRDVGAAVELEQVSDQVLLAALGDPDPKRRARAVSRVEERKLKDAVGPLSDLVRDETQERVVVLRAIGALVAIGDPAAVGALIDAGRRRPPAYLTQIVFAVGALGGKEGQAWLLTLASGHADEGIRNAAKQALAELEKRETKPAP